MTEKNGLVAVHLIGYTEFLPIKTSYHVLVQPHITNSIARGAHTSGFYEPNWWQKE